MRAKDKTYFDQVIDDAKEARNEKLATQRRRLVAETQFGCSVSEASGFVPSLAPEELADAREQVLSHDPFEVESDQ